MPSNWLILLAGVVVPAQEASADFFLLVFSPLLPIGIFPEFMARKVLGCLYYGTSGFLLRWVDSLLLEIPQECSSYG
ncbi:hypothetical protein L1987_09978 [Smallanthus sonchifolius]|uniref:Uncharacterized protein n=1 Tax=Smallanthus sonchifolius TaxID=185202 RepID=A0ACB9JQT5_9ASTR|nr:hypothetical protein L1987_09978 [Smallanthus sonchifolius]